MSEQTKVELANDLVNQLSDTSTLNRSPEQLARLELLIADFLICVASGNKLAEANSLLQKDGAIGLATLPGL